MDVDTCADKNCDADIKYDKGYGFVNTCQQRQEEKKGIFK